MSQPSLFVVGTTHHRAPLEVREKLALGADGAAALRETLTRIAGLREFAILNPCNRVEFYGVAADALAAGDAAALYRMMHPELKAMIDPPLMQAFVAIVAAELGPVTEKKTDALRYLTEESPTTKIIRGTDKIGFKNGSFEVRTTVTEDKLLGFNLAAPQ